MSQQPAIARLNSLSDQLFGHAKKIPPQRVRGVVQLLLLIWIIYSLSRFTWVLLHKPDSDVIAPELSVSALSSTASVQTPVDTDIKKIQAWNLFGAASNKKSEQIIKPTERIQGVEDKAKDTKLKLLLLGVVMSSDEQASLAVISHQNKQQQYVVGEKLPGGPRVVLSKVLTDRVILNNAGRYEALWLFNQKTKGRGSIAANNRGAGARANARRLANTASRASGVANSGSNNSSQKIDRRNDPEITAAITDAKEKLYSDPLSLSELIQVAPAMQNGNLQGYRISPGKNPAQFKALGLQRGDIVTSINGVSLDDPQNSVKLYQQFRTLTEAQIDILRSGELISLQVATE